MRGAGALGVVLHEAREALGEFVGGAAVDEFLLRAVQFGELGEDGGSAQAGDDVRDVADCGVCGDAAEAVRTAALHAQGERGERRGGAFDLVGLSERDEGAVDGLLHERRLVAGLLLIDDDHRLAQLGIARAELFHEQSGLRVLAAEAEHGGAGDVGVVNVAGEQTAEFTRILARAAAAKLVGDEADAVDVGKDALGAGAVRRCCGAAVGLLRDKLAHALTISRSWRGRSRALLRRLL